MYGAGTGGRMPGGPHGGQVQNPLHVTFKNPNWPPNHITPENVLDYFCHPSNVFYDMESNNQTVKMQNIARPLDECLASMLGVQFIVWSAQPPLYVICKQRRNTQTQVTPLAYYYIINGVVYQAPDLFSFSQSRLLGAIDPLKKAFDEMISYSRYNVAKGYYWEFKGRSAKNAEPEKDKPQQARSTNFQSTRTNQLMKLLFDQFPPSSAIEIVDSRKEKDTNGSGSEKMEVDKEEASASTSTAAGSMQPPRQP